MSDIARGQITISNLENEHTFIKWSDDAKTIKFDNPNYRQVEYIQNSYRYYFYIPYGDVGYISSENTRIVIEFNILRIPNTSYSPYIFGNYNGSNNRFSLRYSHTDRTVVCQIWANSESSETNTIRIPYVMGQKMKVDMDFNRVIVNDNDVYNWSENCDKTPFTANYSMRYFQGTNGTTSAGNNYFIYGMIYGIQVYYGGQLRGNYIPVINLASTSKYVTLYNTVLNKVGIAWGSTANAYYVNPSREDGVNWILNGNFKKGLQYWNTSNQGESMISEVVEDEIKGTCLHIKSTDTHTIDISNNTIYQKESGTASNSANRYFSRLDYSQSKHIFVSFYAKASVDNSNLVVIRRSDSTIESQRPVLVGTQWNRYSLEFADTAATSNLYTLGFSPYEEDVDYWITNIKVEYGQLTDYSECPDDSDTYEVSGKYMGTLVWSNDYPSDNFEDYTWVKVEGTDGKDGKDGADGADGKDGQDGKDGVDGKDGKDGVDGINGEKGDNGEDAEFYQLSPSLEKAVVNNVGTLQLNFQYQIEHVKGNTKELVTATSSGFHVQLIPDYGNAINLSVNTTLPLYQNNSYFPNYHTATNKPTYFTVVLLNDSTTVYRKVVPIIFDAAATLSITDSINATVQGHTVKLNNLEVGGRNLIHDSEFNKVETKWTDWGTVDKEYITVDGTKYLHIQTDDHWLGLQQTVVNRFGVITKELLPNKYYTFSADVYGSGKFGYIIHFRNQEQVNIGQYSQVFDLTSTPTRIQSTFLVPNDSSIHHFNIMIGSNHYEESDIYIGKPQLEIGTFGTAWKKAPEDDDEKVNGIVNQVSELNISVDGITSRVETVENNVYEDTNNIFKETSYNGGYLSTNNCWVLDRNNITIENYWENKNSIIYNGTADWFNKQTGTSYLYSPYFLAQNGQTYTMNLEINPHSSTYQIQVVYYSSANNAVNLVANTVQNIGSGSTVYNDIIRFTANANGYCRLRFCNITSNFDEDIDDYELIVDKIRLYKGTYNASDFPEWNTLISKAFSQINQTANEISLQVDEINLKIDNQQIELNGDTVVNGALTLTDEDTGFVLQGEGTTQISPKSIGTYADFSQNSSNNILIHQNNTQIASKNISTGKYNASFTYTYQLGTLNSNTTFSIINHSFNSQLVGTGTLSLSSIICNYRIYENNVLKATRSTSSATATTVGNYTTSAQAAVKIVVSIDAAYTLTNYSSMSQPSIKGVLDYAVLVSTPSFMLMGYNGLAVNFGNNKTAYIGSEGTIINYGNYGIKITNTGLQKYDYNAWIGLNNKHINNVVANTYTVQETDDFIIYNGSSNCTITLPTNLTRGKIVYIKNVSSATLTVSSSANIYPTDSRTAALSRSISNKMTFYIWNGANWYEGQ